MQACEPLPIFFWQIKFAYRPPHTIQTKGERDQGLSRVVVQFARQAASFFLLHTRNQHGITAQFFLAATRAVQICQGLLQGMRANTQARADEGEIKKKQATIDELRLKLKKAEQAIGTKDKQIKELEEEAEQEIITMDAQIKELEERIQFEKNQAKFGV